MTGQYVTERQSREIIERAFDATVRLVVPVEESDEPHATGFFFFNYSGVGVSGEQALAEWDHTLWLVTNRHVLWTNDRGPTAELEICLRDPDYTFGFSLPVAEQRVRLGAEYLAINAMVPNPAFEHCPDIAAVRIDESLTDIWSWVKGQTEVTDTTADGQTGSIPGRPRLRALWLDDCGEGSDMPNIGDQLLTIGYPVGGVDEVTGWPVAKSGAVATPFVGGWEAGDSFLVDINQFKGSSGSPILTAPQRLLGWNVAEARGEILISRPTLRGIHSGGREHRSASVGLGVAWSLPWALFHAIDPEMQPITLYELNCGVPPTA